MSDDYKLKIAENNLALQEAARDKAKGIIEFIGGGTAIEDVPALMEAAGTLLGLYARNNTKDESGRDDWLERATNNAMGLMFAAILGVLEGHSDMGEIRRRDH
jgi:hypothetical protein